MTNFEAISVVQTKKPLKECVDCLKPNVFSQFNAEKPKKSEDVIQMQNTIQQIGEQWNDDELKSQEIDGKYGRGTKRRIKKLQQKLKPFLTEYNTQNNKKINPKTFADGLFGQKTKDVLQWVIETNQFETRNAIKKQEKVKKSLQKVKEIENQAEEAIKAETILENFETEEDIATIRENLTKKYLNNPRRRNETQFNKEFNFVEQTHPSFKIACQKEGVDPIILNVLSSVESSYGTSKVVQEFGDFFNINTPGFKVKTLLGKRAGKQTAKGIWKGQEIFAYKNEGAWRIDYKKTYGNKYAEKSAERFVGLMKKAPRYAKMWKVRENPKAFFRLFAKSAYAEAHKTKDYFKTVYNPRIERMT